MKSINNKFKKKKEYRMIQQFLKPNSVSNYLMKRNFSNDISNQKNYIFKNNMMKQCKATMWKKDCEVKKNIYKNLKIKKNKKEYKN